MCVCVCVGGAACFAFSLFLNIYNVFHSSWYHRNAMLYTCDSSCFVKGFAQI